MPDYGLVNAPFRPLFMPMPIALMRISIIAWVAGSAPPAHSHARHQKRSGNSR